MEYILGTAQFGLDYGVSNSSGKVSDDELIKIRNKYSRTRNEYISRGL